MARGYGETDRRIGRWDGAHDPRRGRGSRETRRESGRVEGERHVARLIDARRHLVGGGYSVRRPLPNDELRRLDPFLIIDEVGPVHYEPGEAAGTPDHPHRGFEAVTYLLEGEIDHRDSLGGSAQLRAGSVQWLTTGAGVVHSELPSERIRASGGTMHGFQIWVNLPAAAKMGAPRYQKLDSVEIPSAKSHDERARIKVVAGSALDIDGRIETHTSVTLLHIEMQPRAQLRLPIPASHNACLYVFGGAVRLGADALVEEGQLAVLGSGDGLRLAVAARVCEPAQMLLLSGEPIGEPVARYGPFVMNTREELERAFDDLRTGQMGRIADTADAPTD